MRHRRTAIAALGVATVGLLAGIASPTHAMTIFYASALLAVVVAVVPSMLGRRNRRFTTGEAIERELNLRVLATVRPGSDR